ncbi:MAG: hypothetical protein AC479_08090 [miscellaneous Crenarchaeota group-6 archaeon AD8-1]|nr:MAG: hypothetical protein AC479_08090 [miscellaneous Crenarchaeota group-6 archaeon AD8-1]
MAAPNYAVRSLIFGLLEAFFVFLLAYLLQTQVLDIDLGFSVIIHNLWIIILITLGLALIITILYGTMRNKMEKNSSIGLLMGFYGVLSLFLLIINQFVFSHFLEQ